MQPSAELNILSLKHNIPLSATLELTYRCVYSCRHCYLPETSDGGEPDRNRELSLSELGKIFRDLKKLGTMSLALTGGEPLLRTDLPEICSLASRNNLETRLYTTLYPADKNLLLKIFAAGTRFLEISLYGREKTYEYITGRKGSFSVVMKNLETARKLNFKIKLKTPLMKPNEGDINWLYSFCKKNGFTISIDPQLTPRNDGSRAPLLLTPSLKALKAALKNKKIFGGAMEDVAGAFPVCGAGRNVIGINPQGEVYPCLQLPVKTGDLRKTRLTRLWKNSPRLNRIRKELNSAPQKCLSCGYQKTCSRCPGVAFILNGNTSSVYPQACLLAKLSEKML